MAKSEFPELRVPVYKRAYRLVRLLVLLTVTLIVSVVVGGFGYQVYSSVQDAKNFPPPGQMVDVGGYKLHAQVFGEGSPTVVFECGLGNTSLDWAKVVPEIAKHTRVVIYDRAGLGWSERGPDPRTSEQAMRELRVLLDALDIPGPYILAGHSQGGVNVRLFHFMYPGQVVGMVLIDSSHEDQQARFPAQIKDMMRSASSTMRLFELLAYIGVPKLAVRVVGDSIVMPIPRQLSDEALAHVVRFNTTPKTLGTLSDELEHAEASFTQAREAGTDLGDLPLVVITAELSIQKMTLPPEIPTEEMAETWNALHVDLASRSTRGRRVIAEGSSHDVALDRPDVVIDAVLAVLREVRNPVLSATDDPEPSEPEEGIEAVDESALWQESVEP